jgi:hypothetical protein
MLSEELEKQRERERERNNITDSMDEYSNIIRNYQRLTLFNIECQAWDSNRGIF